MQCHCRYWLSTIFRRNWGIYKGHFRKLRVADHWSLMCTFDETNYVMKEEKSSPGVAVCCCVLNVEKLGAAK